MSQEQKTNNYVLVQPIRANVLLINREKCKNAKDIVLKYIDTDVEALCHRLYRKDTEELYKEFSSRSQVIGHFVAALDDTNLDYIRLGYSLCSPNDYLPQKKITRQPLTHPCYNRMYAAKWHHIMQPLGQALLVPSMTRAVSHKTIWASTDKTKTEVLYLMPFTLYRQFTRFLDRCEKYFNCGF